MRKLLHNAIQTLDGTILVSRHRHDYVSHLDANGETYILDGGLDYVRTSVNVVPAISFAVYSDDDFEKVRCFFSRGGRGKDGKQPLKYFALKDIDDEWLENIIQYEEFHRPGNIFLEFYYKEKEFRKSLA